MIAFTGNPWCYLTSICSLLLLLMNFSNLRAETQPLYLNEIMASNATTIFDEDGDAEDWIEIFYDGDEPLNLEGYGLSDDYERPMRWEFPDITVHPGEFLLIWASGKDRNDPGEELHTNFAIAMAGEEVLLTSPDGERIDELSPTRIPTDISLGRYPDGTGEWHYFDQPSPEAPNPSTGYMELLEPVEFTTKGGFYTEKVKLNLTHPDPDALILYTLDGSRPDPENLDGTEWQHMDRYDTTGQQLLTHTFRTKVYDDHITIHDRTDEPDYLSRMQTRYLPDPEPYHFPDRPVFKGTVVRAIAVKEGAITDGIKTHSYFITPEGRDRITLPVISLAVQEDHLFDYDDGIYVPGRLFDQALEEDPEIDRRHAGNYLLTGSESERPASMELFETGSLDAGLRQDIGIRIHGGATRTFPLKSLRLYARNEYSENRFHYPVFPELPWQQYNRLILRNSGNDFRQTLFRDAMIQRVIGHMKFDTQAWRPFIVFLNGEYWGLLNMRERYDKHYLSRVHGANPENIDLLTRSGVTEPDMKEGDNTHYLATLDYIESNGLQEDEHYEYVKTRIDVENFIDYQIAQIYSGNTDWPGHNIDFWRSRTDGFDPDAPPQLDGRWRWLAYDLDYGFNFREGPEFNTLQHALGEIEHDWSNPEWSTFLLRNFFENRQFRHDFINRFLDQLNTGFRPERVTEIIREMAAWIEPEVAEHQDRWFSGISWIHFDSWNRWIDNQLVDYAENRPHHARSHLREQFGIPDEHELVADVSDPAAGFIRVNTVELSPDTPGVKAKPWPWTGIYFEGVPVTLTPHAWPGFRFLRWEIGDSLHYEHELELTLTEATNVTAVFEFKEEYDVFPLPHDPDRSPYHFSEWPADTLSTTGWPKDDPASGYPDNMAFVYMKEPDPGPDAEIEGFTSGFYMLETGTRIKGLDEDGFAFINTSGDNVGYPGTQLGGALLGLNTGQTENVRVSWEGKTVEANSRVYNLRLQYRLGDEGAFHDVPDEEGNPVEYRRNAESGHREQIGPVQLPPEVGGKGYVQLLWRYYYTGERLDPESGQRDKLAVTQITVEPSTDTGTGEDEDENKFVPDTFSLQQNYPNPFNHATVIRYLLPVDSQVRLEVFDLLGRRVTTLVDGHVRAGEHTVTFDARELAGGVYIYRLQAGDYTRSRRMTLIK